MQTGGSLEVSLCSLIEADILAFIELLFHKQTNITRKKEGKGECGEHWGSQQNLN